MNRNTKFALSWGRKQIFGISWPISSAIAVIYLKSYILPQSSLDWVFFLNTYFGHFGLIHALVYFLLYCPVILIAPQYYVARFWSLILILLVNFLLLFDALTFANYQLHLYSYIYSLFSEEGFQHLLGSGFIFFIFVAFTVLGIVIWIRGEMVWRQMQAKFSNPVKNWYLVLIVLALLVSKSIYYYQEIHPKLSNIFPLNIDYAHKIADSFDNRKFFYPKMDMACQGKQNPNLVVIVLKEWNQSQFNEEMMPKTYHLKRHAMSFNSHVGVSTDIEGNIFSLFYSLPASYQSAAKNGTAILGELEKRKYEINNFNDEIVDSDPAKEDEETLKKFNDWAITRFKDDETPFYASMVLNRHSSELDTSIDEVIMQLQQNHLLPNTQVVITGAYAGQTMDKIPFLWIRTDRRSEELSHLTSHYDVMPTIMQKSWNCKKVFEAASVGTSMDKEGRDWLLVTKDDDFKIIDLKTNSSVEVKAGAVKELGSDAPREHIFSALKTLQRFSKPD